MNKPSRPKTKRSLIAGLDFSDIRSLLNHNLSDQNSAAIQQSHRLSFFLHFRPRNYPIGAIYFRHTYYLGFLLILLVFVELITGLFLMVYYIPTPDDAYSSILRIINTVPFGELFRDIHRLCGEAIVVVTFLHLTRIFLTQSYEDQRRSTWLTGIVLMMGMLLLAFTGYLLPWDQLAYWAVTIGASMAEAIPVIGQLINRLLKGGSEIGADGLLRFYLLHVAIIPIVCFVFIGLHYYRVSRLHGLAIKEKSEDRQTVKPEKTKVGFLPGVFFQEIFLITICLFVIIGAAYFLYDAPLEHHANPSQTPWNAQAPWYFLWLQGLLKVGDKAIMGVFIPLIFLILLCVFPYLSNFAPFRFFKRKTVSFVIVGIFALVMIGLSYMGTHKYGIQLPSHIHLVNEHMPHDGEGKIHNIPFNQLKVGLYQTHGKNAVQLSDSLSSFLDNLGQNIDLHKNDSNFNQPSAIVMVEDWQHQLKRITLRIQWLDKTKENDHQNQSYQQIIHLHKNTSRSI